MPVSALQVAKRAFVSVLLSVASTYSVKVKVNRDTKDKDLLGAYRQVVKKAHPDKGGDTAKFQRLQAAKEAWEAECQKSPKVSEGCRELTCFTQKVLGDTTTKFHCMFQGFGSHSLRQTAHDPN